MTCKECIHYELCEVQAFNGFNKNFEPEKDWKHCGVFKDKSKYIELPCKVGDVVYWIGRKSGKPFISEEIVQSICCDVRETIEFTALNPNGKILKYFFPTKSKAEQKLKELKENA